MTLREIVSNETISVLTEEKVSSLVEYIIKRYDGSRKHYGHRIEATYNSKNEMDKRLYDNDNKPLFKYDFHKACVALFDKRAAKEKVKIPRNEFIITLNNYLSYFDDDGYLLPRVEK